MPIVTIRGQMGSGAHEIGRQVAAGLHADYIDREIIAEIAEHLRRTKEGVAGKEMPPGTIWGRLVEALGRSGSIEAAAYLRPEEIPIDDGSYLAGLKSVMKELAKNELIVIYGRGSQFILKDKPGILHVSIVAPLGIRLKRVMESRKIDGEEAKKEIERDDSSRREFARRYFRADLEDPLNYTLVINTEYVGFDAAASIIVNAIPYEK